MTQRQSVELELELELEVGNDGNDGQFQTSQLGCAPRYDQVEVSSCSFSQLLSLISCTSSPVNFPLDP